MKRILQQTFAVLLMAVAALTASALDFSSGDLMYTTNGESVYVTGLTSTAKGKSNLSLTIPATVTYSGTTYRVWGINANAFMNATNISNVTIKWSCRVIGENAFQGCTGITWVRLASSVARMDLNTFGGCTALKTVYYPGFDYPALSVSPNVWPSNSGMTLYIPWESSHTPAEYKAKSGWTQFATVTQSIEAYDYYMNDGGLYCVGKSDTDAYTVTRNVTLTGFNTNGSQTSSGTVYSPIGGGTFSPSGQSITFKVTSLGARAFNGQTTLKTVTLPNTITSYRPSAHFFAFTGASSLTAINVASGNNNCIFSSYEGCLYSSDGTGLNRVPEGKTSVNINPITTYVGVRAFCNSQCQTIRLPYGLKTIDQLAFEDTKKLDWLYIPSSVTSIGADALYGTKSNIYIYINMPTPPSISMSTMFGSSNTLSGAYLFVPYGKVDAYKSAGWTGFSSYNYSGKQAYDIQSSSLPYTVTSTASTTVNGTSYNGRVKLVCSVTTGDDVTSFTVPASITYNGKTYAVTKIGEDAFNNHTSNFTVAGCANVDTIADYAFQDQPITSYAFTHKLRYIMAYAFDGAGLTGSINLPYGVSYIGNRAFGHGKYSRLVVPSSLYSINGAFCANTSTLTDLVFNKTSSSFYNYTGWNLTDVPSTCTIRVPTGVVQHYKNNSALSSRANYITAGAYDFSYNNGHGKYLLTILSNSSTTYSGMTYDGKAKYVYHPNIQNSTETGSYGFDTYEEDRTVSGDIRKYLITEIGDSLLYGSKYTGGVIPTAVTRIGQSAFRNCAYAVSNLSLPSGLTFIGHDAFYQSKITGEVKVPTSVTKLEEFALCASTLSSIYFPDMTMPTMGSSVWSQSIEKVWVPNAKASQYLSTANGWGTNYGAKINVWIKPYAATQPFSSVVPTNLSGSNINAYYASGYDKSNTGKEVTLTKANQAPENTGLLLVDLNTSTEYRISRPTNTVSAPMTNYFVANPSSTVNVNAQTVGYYWEYGTKKFIDPTSTYNVYAGSAYLKLSSSEASGKSEVYTNLYPKQNGGLPGDCDGNGVIDINDVNIAINVMLGKDTNPAHVAAANANGMGGVDIADVNAIINKMLGK